MIKDSQVTITFLKRFLKRVANMLVALVAGFTGYYVAMSIAIHFLFNPIFDLPQYRLFGSRISLFIYTIEVLGFVVGAIFLIKVFRKYSELIRKEQIQAAATWLERGKNNFSLGFWTGICLGFLLPLVMQVLLFR